MEKKTVQRIIGILIVIALVIILLPLLFNKKAPVMQSSAAIEPAFPEQAVVSSEEESAMNKPVEEAAQLAQEAQNDVPVSPPAVENTPTPVASTPSPALQTALPVPDVKVEKPTPDSPVMPLETTKSEQSDPLTPSVSEAKTKKASPSAAVLSQSDLAQDIVIKQDGSASSVVEVKSNAFPIKEKSIKTAARTHDKTLSHLKKTAWAVQLGSFKSKRNAQRLADKLRAVGYQAFIREAKSKNGSEVQTRVYIGPEYRQASAVKLSAELESEMHIRGFVVTYKPLEL